MAFLKKIKSIDAPMRLLVPKKVSEDDMLVDYGSQLGNRFLDILESLHGKSMRETVKFPKSCCATNDYYICQRFELLDVNDL